MIDRYQAALHEHKHYDNASLVIATAIILIPGAAFQLAYGKDRSILIGIMVFGTALTIAVFLLYRRMAAHASIARQVMAAIEVGSLAPSLGIAAVYLAVPCPYKAQFGFVYRVVAGIALMNMLFMLCFAISY